MAVEEHTGTAEVIERAALELFYERGYHGTSIRQIAGATGIGVATLFHHYPNKAAILERILFRAVDELQAELDAAVAGLEDPRERLVAAVRVLVIAHCERQSSSFVATSELRSLEEPAAGEIRVRRRAVVQVVAVAVQDGVDAGVFHCRRPRDVARAIVSLTTQVAMWFRADGELSPAAVADQHAGLALRMAGDFDSVSKSGLASAP